MSRVARASFSLQGLRKKYQTMLNDRTALNQMGSAAIELMDPYVPRSSGQVAESARMRWVDVENREVGIRYTAAGPGAANYPEKSGHYVHYIYEGEVYGPNIRNKKGKWYSPPGEPKAPTGDEMEYHNGGQAHWGQVLARGGEQFDEYSRAVREILRERWKQLNG